MNIIVVNQNDIISSLNNTFRYKFRNSVPLYDKEITLSSVSMYYSWNNISAKLKNNTFTVTTRVGTTNTINTITIPDGIYQIKDINEYFQQWSIDNGFYLVDTNGDYIYFANFAVNNNLYSVDIITYAVPTSLPSGYTEPSNWIGYATQTYNPIITLTANFNKIVGYTDGYATLLNLGVGTTLSYQSSTAPDISANTETLLVSIDNIDNNYTGQSAIIYAVTATVAPGEIIAEKPSNFVFAPFIRGIYSEIIIRFLDTNYQPVDIRDPNIVLTFVIRDKKSLI